MKFQITPIGKPTATQRTKNWRLKEFYKYRDDVRVLGIPNYISTYGTHVKFVLPMPKSWPRWKKMRMNGTLHAQKPDLDNLIKALLDACFPGKDQTISDLRGTKVWGEEGQIVVLKSMSHYFLYTK